MSNHIPQFDDECIMHEQFLKVNTVIIGALAWAGYLEKSRGALVVYMPQESEAQLSENIQAEVAYLSRAEAVQDYPEGTQLHQFVDEYNPGKAIVVTFTDIKASLVDSWRITLIPPPPECYALIQKQMLEQTRTGNDHN